MGATESKGFTAPFSAGLSAAVLPQCAGGGYGCCSADGVEEVVAMQGVHLQSVMMQGVPPTVCCSAAVSRLDLGPLKVERSTTSTAEPSEGGGAARSGDESSSCCSSGTDEELRQASSLMLEGAEGAFGFLSIGMKRQQSGDLNAALDAFREALQIRRFMIQSGGDPKRLRSQELHSALFLIKEAIDISECTGTQVTAESALLGGLYGILCHIRGDVDQAAEAYPKAIKVMEALDREEKEAARDEARGVQRALLLQCLGDVRSEMGDHDGALESYMEAHQIRLVKRMLQTYQGALLMMSIGLTRLALDDPLKALEAYTLAALVFDSFGGTKTNTFAVLLTYIGEAKIRLGDITEALTSLGEARNLRRTLGTLEGEEGRHLEAQLVRARWQRRSDEEILVLPRENAGGTEPTGLYVQQVDPVEPSTTGDIREQQ